MASPPTELAIFGASSTIQIKTLQHCVGLEELDFLPGGQVNCSLFNDVFEKLTRLHHCIWIQVLNASDRLEVPKPGAWRLSQQPFVLPCHSATVPQDFP